MSSTYKSNVDAVKKAIKKAEKEALREIGEVIEKEAKARAPYDPDSRHPQHLIDSITTGIKGNKVSIGIEDNETFSKSDRYYARFQEFGTIKMDSANNGKGYLRPAAEENINQVIKITKKNLGEVGR